ncbi:hypothetical protein AXF42_Ash005297 [Apostasia shenzhenica]|uniref:Sugar-phosphatase n=1 Tax=Apostasia shenzhenica TaxID=1088818 RepID=A0A2I0B6J1_9ASPA|nr:hypothetical protein AXF42_Ash005297 [Apostasia shenzhenica]
MATLAARALLLGARSSLSLPLRVASSLSGWPPVATADFPLPVCRGAVAPLFVNCPKRRFFVPFPFLRSPIPPRSTRENARGYRKGKWRRRPVSRKKLPKERFPELDVRICIEEELPNDPAITIIAEKLRMDVSMAAALAFSRLDNAKYETRDASVKDVDKYETVEISLLICNDDFIQKLNKDWRGEDHATDVLSMSQHIPELDLPVLMLGDIVVSVETAAQQAEERGHTLLDEIRILMVHGLLHLLGFDHEISKKAEEEMETEEEMILTTLGWKGKGLIKSTYDSHKQKFSYIFCDMDGTLLNSSSKITMRNAQALKEAISNGVRIVIVTGKSRPAVVSALEMASLAGNRGVVSESSLGVFLQVACIVPLVNRDKYGNNQALLYSLKHTVPVVAFSQDRCLTLFQHPLVDRLHETYYEPKAEIIPSVDQLLAASEIQKLLFLDTAEGISSLLRPYWSEAIKGQATVVQAVPDMLEIVPLGTSKGSGIRLLLDHLGVSENEVMAIGDGENDIEMLKLASLGVALANGSDKVKAVADVIGLSNDEDGVAEVIYKHVL